MKHNKKVLSEHIYSSASMFQYPAKKLSLPPGALPSASSVMD